MPARLRKTRSSAFRANAPFASPSKGSVGRPAKKLKLDRGRSSSKTLLRESHAAESESEDDGEVADDSDEEGEEDVDHSDSTESEQLEDQENVDPVTNSSGTIGPSRRRLRNGKSVLRNQKGSGGYLTSRGHRRSGLAFPVYSPRKRKRDDPEYTDDDDAGDDSDEYTDDENANEPQETDNISSRFHNVEGLADLEEGVDDSSSEPDYIDENDQHLLREASAWTLGRLKKAELKRLWLVAGLWDGEDLGGNDEMDTTDAMTKDVLVDGIIRARPPSSVSTASSSNRKIAKLPPASRDTTSYRDTQRSVPICDSHGNDDQADDASSSQGFSHRSKAKLNGNAIVKPINGLKSASRTRNSSGSSMSHDKRAHFDITQQSPAHTYRKRRESYASSIASSSMSANGSPKRNGPPSTPRPFAKRGKVGRRSVNFDEVDEDDASETGSNVTADDYDGSHKRSQASGKGPGRRNSKASSERMKLDDKHLTAFGKGQSSLNRHTPARRAARKATRAMHDQLDTDEGDVMEVTDIEDAEEGSDDPTPKPRNGKILTRARSNTTRKTDSSPLRGKTRRLSTTTLTASPDTDSSKRSSVLGPTSSDEDNAESVYSSQQSSQRRVKANRSRNRRGSGYNLRRNDSSGFDLDTRLGGIDLTDDDEAAMEAESPTVEEDVDMAEQTSENTEVPGDDSHDEEHGEDEVSDEVLATATQATLKKFKKDVLVRMCEARELDTEGTKEQLSQWLIEWRDSASRSTSSASTARPDSPASEQADKSRERRISVPKLLRDHSEVADPHTPAHSHGDTKDDVEADGALDLEELGLVDKEIPVEQVQKGDKIGSGGFKDVFIGKLRGRAKVAVCEFRDELSEMDIRELKLLAEFKHPNIVRLLGIAIPERSLHVPCMVVTELCEKGDLFDYIRNVDRPPTHRVLKMMLDIAQGLTYLHDRNPRVIHRDCKSSNILITSRGVCKVGDFGLARVKNTTRSVIRSLVGTVNWQAPELWSPKPRYDYKVDVFSCGMVFWEMLAGWTSEKKQYPWEGENEHWIYLNVGQNKVRPETESLITHWGSDLVHLMERMWHHDPNERPLMSDVVDDLTAIMEVHRRS